jgi:hypothetical protein
MDRNFPSLRDAAAGGGRQAPPSGAPPPAQFGAPPAAQQQHAGGSSPSEPPGIPPLPGGLSAAGRERGFVATVKDSYAFIRCAPAPAAAAPPRRRAICPRSFSHASATPKPPKQGCGSLLPPADARRAAPAAQVPGP